METNLFINDYVTIPEYELEITTSRSGGAGGQHVNKTDSRVTIRWNVATTVALTDEQKQRVLDRLKSRLTADGDLIVNNSQSRSQQQNRDLARVTLADVVRKALYVPKTRIATRVSKAKKEARLESKARRSSIKKMRNVRRSDV